MEPVVSPSTIEEGLEAGQCPDGVVRQDDHVDRLVKAGGEGGEELGPHLPLEATAAVYWVGGTGHQGRGNLARNLAPGSARR